MATKILIADDDAGYRYPLVKMFREYGYDTIEASDDNGIIKNAKSEYIWIIDVRLPTEGNEGIRAVHQLAQNNIRSNYSVIFISVNLESDPQMRKQLDALEKEGIDFKYIEKFSELELLLREVQRLDKK